VLDLVLRNGTVIDGLGRPRFVTDIGISGGKIVALNDLRDAEAGRTLDISNLCVCPGFIDMHSHSDLSIMAHGRAESSISQGITTEVVGSCGWSMAPVKEETKRSVLHRLLTGLVNEEAVDTPNWTWHSFGEFLEALERRGTGVNIVPQVGQSLIRAHVVGTEKRNATPGEIEAMKALLASCMEEGAWGMSTGRSYRPGGFAPREEIVALAKVVARFGGIYATHMKSEGDDLFEAVEEAISIAQEAEVRVEISHHKAVGKRNFGKVERSLDMVREARRKGLPVSVDLYPYEFAQVSSLLRLFPIEIWDYLRKDSPVNQQGRAFPSQEEIEEKLKDPSVIQKLLAYPGIGEALDRMRNYLIVRAPSAPDLEGKILGDYLDEKAMKVEDFLLKLIQKDGFEVHGAWPISMEDVHKVAKAEFATIGTDAFTLDRPISPTPIHPRHFGTFPRVIGRFVREDALFSLEEAVRKCTYLPATVMGIPARGAVSVGYWADLVVFDPAEIKDTATAKEPYKKPEGISYVIINGKVALENGEVKPLFAGKVLRH